MDSEIVNPWKEDRTVLNVLGIYIGILGVAMGVYYRAWLPVIVLPLVGISLVTMISMDQPHVVLNDAGVAVRFVVIRRFFTWAELQQAGICLFEIKKACGIVHKVYKMGLLLPNGVPKRPGQRISYHKNMGRIVYLPDTQQIRDFVIAYYGLLDFDESVDPRGYSIVVD